MELQNSKKWIWIVLIIAIIVGAAWFFFNQKGESIDTADNTVSAPDDSTIVMEKDLNAIDLGDLEKEMQDVEKDINNL